jgi:signal transduction histidine kinase
MKAPQQLIAFWGLIVFSLFGLSLPIYTYILSLRQKLKWSFNLFHTLRKDIDYCALLYGRIVFEGDSIYLKNPSKALQHHFFCKNLDTASVLFHEFSARLLPDEKDYIRQLLKHYEEGVHFYHNAVRQWRFYKNKKGVSFFIEDHHAFDEDHQRLTELLKDTQKDQKIKNDAFNQTHFPAWHHDQGAKKPKDIVINDALRMYLKHADGTREDFFDDYYFDSVEKLLKEPVRFHKNIQGKRYTFLKHLQKGEGGKINGVLLDITNEAQLIKELHSTQKLHESVLHYLTSPIAIFSKDSRLTFYNEAYLNLFHYEEDFLKKKPRLNEMQDDLRMRQMLPEHINHQQFKQSRMDLFHTLLEPIEEVNHHPDGRVLRIVITPHPLGGLVYIFTDISEQIALERRYNTLMAVQKETIDHLTEGLLVIGSDSCIRFYNHAFIHLWGLDEHLQSRDHVAKLWNQLKSKFHHEDTWDGFLKNILQGIHSRHPFNNKYIVSINFIIDVHYVPLPDGSHLITFNDISDQWKFEKTLKERNKLLEDVSKMKSDFISHVTYELKSPLNTILGFVEILQNEYFGPINDRQKDYCNGIRESSQRLLSLIEDMIELAGLQSGVISLHIEEIVIETFLSNVVALVYNHAYDCNIQMTYQNCASLNVFHGDEKRLKQALFNLLTNAIKFTPNYGSVELMAEQEGAFMVFVIKDTGKGMNDETLDAIQSLFDTQEQSLNELINQPRQSGAGIGLPLVKRIVDLHKGHVKVDSYVDKGTTFRFYLPLKPPVTR